MCYLYLCVLWQIAEFSAANRPVLTSSAHHDNGMARFHIDTLGSKGLFYHDQHSCEQLMLTFDRREAKLKDWNAYRAFQPSKVMATFKAVFLDSTEGGGAPADQQAAKLAYDALMRSGTPMPCYGK